MTRNTFMRTVISSACSLLTCLLPALIAADDGLVSRWSFDDDAAGVIKNSANGNFDAKSPQNFPRVEGVHGKAVDLSGNYQIEIPANFVPSRLTELTFSAWIAPRSLGRYANIIRKDDVSGPVVNRLLFALQEDGRYLSLGLTTGGNYAECDGVIAPEELLDGQWHFVAGTFDGKTMRVYLDGKEVGSYERQSSQIDTSADFRPLKKYWFWESRIPDVKDINETTVNVPGFIGSSAGQGEFYQGKLDDLRFYSRALSPGEIQAEFAKVRPAQTLVDKSLEAQKLYKKSETFTQIYQPDGNGPKEPKSQALQFKDTLTFTSTNVFNFLNNGVRTDSKDCNGNPIPPKYASWDAAKAALMPNALLVQLHRLIREDFPAETNDYLVRFNMSPVEIMTWSEDAQKKRINELRDAFTEYMPLTENQWQVLSAKDKGKWRAAQSMLEGLDDKGVNFNLYEVLFIMMREIHARPQVSERVAPYRKAETPAVKDRSGEEAKQIIEAEWLFQCGGKPSLERILQEIQWTKALAERFVKQAPGLRFDAEMKQLDEIEAKTANANWTDKELYFAVRRIKRSIAFKNPVIDFDSIVYVDGPMPDGNESRHETRHRLGYMAVPGGRLMTLKGLHPGGHQTKLMPQEPLHGSFWRPDLSYDGKRVLVGFKPHNEKNFHIYEVKVDGSMERQLTSGIFDDFDPIYLPDGKNIMFLTSRGHIYVRCMPPTNAFVLARMSLDTQPGDKNLYIISRNGEPEYTPSVMNDGRVVYTRWEYTDKPLWRAQSLWTMNSDGTQVQTFWGNQSVWPDLLKDARSIPGSERVMFTGTGHHNWFGGSIGIIDPGKGFNFPDGLTKVTQELVWVESGNGAIDPKESNTYHTAGNYGAYYSPYPLSEKDFLVSAERQMSDKDGKPLPSKWVLLLMDTDGNRELVFEGDKHIFDAQPIRSRNVPQVAADRVDWPDWDSRDKPKTGVIYSNNVYENAPAELRGKAKYLRIWSIEHKTYTYWSKRNYVSSGPEISPVQSEGVKKIIGTVPVEEDGSVSFTAPSGIALHFQLLDKNQLALQTMKSFTGVLPGETRGCLGCHESMTRSPVTAQTGKALKRPRSNITPVPWEDITVGYERYVQPVLDKHCGQCHQNPEHKAYQKFNATLRPGFLGFKEPYMTLVGNPTWGRKYEERKDAQGGFGWADIIMVEGYGTHDPAAYATYPPMKKLSYKSRLVHRLMSGEHNNVKVSGDELLRVILWVDAMAPYYGAEEVRCMEDPLFQGKDWISQRPRIMTAPIVQRPGPFDPFFTDSAYDAPEPAKYNALPVGVSR